MCIQIAFLISDGLEVFRPKNFVFVAESTLGEDTASIDQRCGNSDRPLGQQLSSVKRSK
ncbi:MAG: hypothetical protein AAF652_03725 [Cyanobacteria bacterium P01_C01_bin.72]